MIRLFLYGLLMLLAFLAPVAHADELHITSSGDIQAIGQVSGKNASNLLTLKVWGYKLKVFIESRARVEAIDGNIIKLEEILDGHTVEIKGKMSFSQTDLLEPALVRDLSLGKKAEVVMPVPASPDSTVAEKKDSDISTDLSLGMRGKEVSILQRFLQKGGWGIPDDGPVTGYFGGVTKKSLMNFQKAKGIAAVGIAGPQTRQLINSLLTK